MNLRKIAKSLLVTLLVVGLGAFATGADEKDKDKDKEELPKVKPADPGTLVILDSAGKEQKVKSWRFTRGTTKLTWLVAEEKPAPKKEEKPAPKAIAAGPPEALIFRDDLRVHFEEGAVALIPLDRLRALDFDAEKKTVTARVATSGKGEDVVLTGSTRYAAINQLTIEADVDLGEAGVASLTFQGGGARNSIRGIRFPGPRVPAQVAGRPAVVVAVDKSIKRAHKVSDLTPLYQVGRGAEKLMPALMFKKTLKLDVSKIKKIVAPSPDDREVVWEVTHGENALSLTLIERPTFGERRMELRGLLGKSAVGYRLFPPHAISEVIFDSSELPKEEKEKEKEKDKDE